MTTPAPAPVAALVADPLLALVDEFTAREVDTFDVWEAAVTAGFPAEAKALLRSGLRAEHYLSRLSANRDEWTDTQRHNYEALQVLAGVDVDAFVRAKAAADQAAQDQSPLQGSGEGAGAPGSGESAYDVPLQL